MKRLYLQTLQITAFSSLLSYPVSAELINKGASYGDRFGSSSFQDDAIPTELCEAGDVPNCLFGMDIGQIQISFNKVEETLKGFKTTFLEIDSNTKDIIDFYTCTHGDVKPGDDVEIIEVEP